MALEKASHESATKNAGVPSKKTTKTKSSAVVEHSIKSPRNDARKLDLEISRLEALEADIARRLGQTKIMSESDYARRRDELNRLLQRDEQEIREIIQETAQARKDKRNVESAYTDVQEKYERVLKNLLALKEKEDLLVQRDTENVLKIKEMDDTLEKFKDDAKRQVAVEYQSWLSKLAEAEATNLRLKAILRKAEMRVEKLEHELGQKNKENNELHNLCDELINSSRKSSRQD